MEIDKDGMALCRYDVDNIALHLQSTGVKNLHISCDMWGLSKLMDMYVGWLNVPVRDDVNDMVVVKGVHPTGQGMFIIVRTDATSGMMEFLCPDNRLAADIIVASIRNYSTTL